MRLTYLPIAAPVAGYYRTKLVRGGTAVPVRIWYGAPLDPVTGEELDRSHRWQCLCNGEEADASATYVWCQTDPIDKATYDRMLARKEWAVVYAPAEPEANPRRAINPRETAPVGPPRRV